MKLPVGELVALWCYPVKSMQGFALDAATLTERGLPGDRAYALLDLETGHVASAKHPRKWPSLLACRAVYESPPVAGAPLPPVRITLPDGTTVGSDRPDLDRILSRALGREVSLIAEAPALPTREANRTPVDSAPGQEVIREEVMATAAPPGTFFDYAPVHLLTTATLERLRELYPAGRFDARRFRPNLVIAPPEGSRGFVENDWPGRTLLTASGARLEVIEPSPRCVVTTLAQDDLPRDPGILRTVVQHSSAPSATAAPGATLPGVVGVYASVQGEATLRRGERIYLLDVPLRPAYLSG